MRIRIIEVPPLEPKFREHLIEGSEWEATFENGKGRGQQKYWVKTPAGKCALLSHEVEVIRQ